MPSASPPSPDASTGKHKFLMLDALRGIAALIVVHHHTPELFRGKYFYRGYLAVDFFFLLSGFVLTFAYQQRLDSGWPSGSFFKSRIARLYPMYLLGLPLGLLAALLVQSRDATPPHPAALTLSFLLGLLLIPFLPLLPFSVKAAYPLNFPTWSLFGETVANVVHALFLRRASQRVLLTWLALSFTCILLGIARAHTIDIGVGRVGVLLGIPRVLFSYVLGILLFKRWSRSPFSPPLPALFACLLLPLALAIPRLPRLDPVADLAIVALLFPAILLLALSPSAPGPAWSPVLRTLGTISYPLYILHAPLVALFGIAVAALTSHPVAQYAPWSGLLFLLLASTLSLVAERLYDIPTRNALRRLLHV